MARRRQSRLPGQWALTRPPLHHRLERLRTTRLSSANAVLEGPAAQWRRRCVFWMNQNVNIHLELQILPGLLSEVGQGIPIFTRTLRTQVRCHNTSSRSCKTCMTFGEGSCHFERSPFTRPTSPRAMRCTTFLCELGPM